MQTLEKVFSNTNGSADAAQQVLRATLSKSPSLMMDSGLGIGIWQTALGYSSAQELVKAQPEATLKAVTSNNGNATTDSAAVLAVVNYIEKNPQEAVKIAEGTGIWGKNLTSGVAGVVNYITANARQDGNNETAIAVAKATATWSGVVGTEQVGNAIAGNSSDALTIARGTAAAEQIFGEAAVTQAISADPSKAVEAARAINAAKEAGYSDKEIKAYIQANPDTYQNYGK